MATLVIHSSGVFQFKGSQIFVRIPAGPHPAVRTPNVRSLESHHPAVVCQPLWELPRTVNQNASAIVNVPMTWPASTASAKILALESAVEMLNVELSATLPTVPVFLATREIHSDNASNQKVNTIFFLQSKTYLMLSQFVCEILMTIFS